MKLFKSPTQNTKELYDYHGKEVTYNDGIEGLLYIGISDNSGIPSIYIANDYDNGGVPENHKQIIKEIPKIKNFKFSWWLDNHISSITIKSNNIKIPKLTV